MISYLEALEKVLENIHALDVEEKPLARCLGQVSAEDSYCDFDLPLADSAGPDGYAVRSEDIKKASRDNPVTLRIIDTVRAGRLPAKLVKPGTASRIMTGSVVPGGADCVVRFEDTDEPGNKSGPNPNRPSAVKIYVTAALGDNIRRAGSNVVKGSLILPRGSAIGPAQLSALATVGKATVKVFRRPVCAVIPTGDELIGLEKPLSPGKVYECNAAAIAALVTHYGGIPRVMGIARDNEASLLAKINKATAADVIITSGGVSMGDYDLVRLVIGKIGRVIFSKINMGPGASFAFGLVNRPSGTPVPVFALAGPPVGCLNNFEILVRPALLKMLGFTALEHPVVEAVADDAVPGKRPMAMVKWTDLDKAQDDYQVTLNFSDNIGSLAALATANSLTIIPEGTAVRKGDRIPVLPLDWCRDYQAQ
jgi:molybdopterin molybdotransferase